MSDIKIKYDGSYPNLCSGQLVATIDGKKWVFPEYCLSSGGGVYFDEDWNEEVTSGEWCVSEYPEEFPEELKDELSDAVNENIPYGCCGGCV